MDHPIALGETPTACLVCGPTGFVETVADMLVALGHDARRIETGTLRLIVVATEEVDA